MSKFRSKTPVIRKEIQPIIHLNIQPVITIEIQPVINKQILPVIHKEIQPVIYKEIQPVITTEIQPIIHKEIQPVIFMENQTDIEEIIHQLQQSSVKEEIHITKNEVQPSTKTQVKNLDKIIIQPMLQRVVKEIHDKEVVPETQTIERHEYIVEYVPYIQYKNGKILLYEKTEKNAKNTGYITVDKEINSSSKIMETIMAVIFVSLDKNINYPVACRKTDIFKNIEKKLYHEFPTLKSKKIYFVANGNVINSSSTIEQNKIENGNTILINESE